MGVFCVGGAFLSLEAFELPYLLLLLGAQLPLVLQPAGNALVAAVSSPAAPQLAANRLPLAPGTPAAPSTARGRYWARQGGSA